MGFGLNPRHAGHYLYAGLSNGFIGCWDLHQIEEKSPGKIPEARWIVERSYRAHEKACSQIEVDVRVDSVSIVSCGKDKRLYIEPIEGGGKKMESQSCKGWCHTINAFTMDQKEDRMFCTFGKYVSIYAFDIERGDILGTFEGHTKRVNCLQVIQSKSHENKEFLISGSYDNSVRVWDLDTQQCLCKRDKHHVSYIYDLVVSRDIAITASRDTSLAMWRLSEDRRNKNVTIELKTTFGVPRSESLRRPPRPLTAHPNRVWCCSLYPRDQNVCSRVFSLALDTDFFSTQSVQCTSPQMILITLRKHTGTCRISREWRQRRRSHCVGLASVKLELCSNTIRTRGSYTESLLFGIRYSIQQRRCCIDIGKCGRDSSNVVNERWHVYTSCEFSHERYGYNWWTLCVSHE